MADAPLQTVNDLENSRPLDVHRWSEFPEVRAAVNDLFRELRTTNAARNANANKLKIHLRVVLIDLYHNHLVYPGAYTAYSRNRNSYGSPNRPHRRCVYHVDLLYCDS